MRKARAKRRPLYQSHIPWCCKCCREAGQLSAFLDGDPAPTPERFAAMEIMGAYQLVAYGRYGGVTTSNLFD